MPDGERIPLEPAARIAPRRGDLTLTAPSDVHTPLLGLQRRYGNQFVARMLARAAEEGGATLTPAVEDEIERERGGGTPLAGDVRTKLEGALGADLGGVRVHAGPRADELSRALNARAFTTGPDVFFRADAYDTSSSAGRELLAHELTHVVQQGNQPVQAKLELGPADDEYEREADDVASSVVQRWHEAPAALRRQPVPEEDEEPARMQRLGGRIGRRVQRTCADCDHAASTGKTTGCSECGGEVIQASRTHRDVAAGLLDRPPPALHLVRRAGDFDIVGKERTSAAHPMRLFFAEGSATLDAAESAKIVAIATPLGRALELHGFASEEGSAAANAVAVGARIAAVDAALAAAGHTGPRTPQPRAAAGAGRIDYRFMRSVEVVPVGAPSATPDCSAGPGVPCGPVPNPFSTAQARANTLLGGGIAALTGPPGPAATALLTEFFGGVGNAAVVRANLVSLRAHVVAMSGVGRHGCHNECDASCLASVAYNVGTGAGAVMTLCPSFMSEPDIDERAGTLIHEGAHGTSGLATEDHAYAHERLIRFLAPAQALKNSDSYVLFVRLLATPGSMHVGPAAPDVVVTLAPAQQTEFNRSLAWLEKWLIWAYQDVSATYSTIHDSRAAAAWTNTYYEDAMTKLAARFPLTPPPALPTMTDQRRVAAIHDRLHTMRKRLGSPVTATLVAAGGATWAPGPGPTVTVGPAFFALAPMGQLNALLRAIIAATPDISSAREPDYAYVVDALRVLRGGGGP